MWRNKFLRLQAEETGGETSSGAGPVMEELSPGEPASEATADDVNWGDIAQDLVNEDEGQFEGDETVVEETPAAAPTTPTETPAEPATTTPEPTPQPTKVEEQVPLAPEVPTTTAEQYAAWRTDRLGQLEKLYALDEAAATAMLTEPETVLPKVAARLHIEVLENAMRAMQAMVPVMVQQLSHHTTVESKAKNMFTSINPDLADPKLEPVILELGAVYRNVNKTAPPEVAAQAIGNLVRAALGIAAPAGGAPSAPVQQVPQGAPAVVPFSPARGAGGGQAPVTSSNPFEALAREMENEGW